MDDIIFNLYVNRKFSLRMIAEKICKDHHFVKRRLESMGVIITTHDRKKGVLQMSIERRFLIHGKRG